MILDQQQLLHCMERSSFRLAVSDEQTSELVFARRVGKDLFERIRVMRGTQRLKSRTRCLVGAYVECSLVPGRTAVKGLIESQFLELDGADEDGWLEARSADDVAALCDDLCTKGPNVSRQLRLQSGETLLASTRELRRVVAECIRAMPETHDIAARLAQLRSETTPEQLAQVSRLMKDRIVLIPGAECVYEASCLEIIKQNEDASLWASEDRELVLTIQLLASHLAREPGWDWEICGD